MSKTVKLVLAGVVVLAILGGAGIWWFLQDDAPEEANLADAVATAEEVGGDEATTTSDGGEGTTGTAADAAGAGVEGTWVVDTSIGTFDFSDSASATYVGFRIDEELQGIGSTTAVGRTPEVAGGITIEGTTLTAATFEADMTAITTNESRRDSRVQSALETGRFPTATFTLTEPVDLGATAATGGPVSVTAAGELTVHGVTRPVEIALEAQLSGDIVVVVGSLDVVFADYGVEVPSAPIVVSAEDDGIIEVQLFLTQA